MVPYTFIAFIFAIIITLINESSSALHPIIFVPGNLGSKLEAAYDRSYISWPPYCPRKAYNEILWFEILNFAPIVKDCWLQNIRLAYNPATRKSYSPADVVVTPKGFGSTNGVDYIALPPEQLTMTMYFENMINAFVRMGYRKNVNLKGAPYDFRKAYYENPSFVQNFKLLIEQTVEENGGLPVIIVAHSMGCMFTYAFLLNQSEAWKSRYIKGWAVIGGPFGGEFKRMYGYFANDDYPASYFPISRIAERTFSAQAFLLPRQEVWGNEKLVYTTTRNYTAYDYLDFFTDLGMPYAYEQWLDASQTYDVGRMQTPGDFPVLCLIGINQRTLAGAVIHGELRPPSNGVKWTPMYGDGDTFVNYDSGRTCLQFGKNNPNFVYQELNTDHLGLIRENEGINVVAQFVSEINGGG